MRVRLAAAITAMGIVLKMATASGPCVVDIEMPDVLESGAMLGASVAMDGDLLAVGAPLDTGVAWASGAVHVYRLESAEWVHDATLVVDDADWGDMLGVDVDLQGDTIIAGAWFHDAFGSNSGAAYVFTRTSEGNWSDPIKLVPPDPGAEDVFGRTVALGDGFCAVGAPLDDDQGSSSGSIHIFDQQPDGSWTHAAKLVSPQVSEGHQLGLGLAADGDRIVGGSPWAFEGRGLIRLWERFGSTWTTNWFMTMESFGNPDDYFGFSVSLAGSRMAAGCYRDDTYGTDAGSVWVMEEVFDGWSFERLSPILPEAGAQFGVAVSLSNEHLLVGSRFAQVDGLDAGRVDVISTPSWEPMATLLPPVPATEAEFGWACDIQGDRAVVGALYQPEDGAIYAWSGMTTPCGCSGDLNSDGVVDVNDLLTVLKGWGGTGGMGDANDDGMTDVDDLLIVIASWGPC